ncbi:MAG: hypothetical protein JNK82_38855 [Myxococcaceae bacterium]|nr:hypothetical protein [Myxococcaceae bacterium]
MPAPAAAAAPEPNFVQNYTSPAVDTAVANIESSYGWGLMPDMEEIDKKLMSLNGMDLLATLKRLEADDKLESVLNRMTPDERQHVVNKLVHGKLVERDPKDDKLKGTLKMPPAFQTMLNELNTLASKEKPATEFTYNWSGYKEDRYDVEKRKLASDVASLKPGDSMQLEVKVGGTAQHMTATGEAKVDVKRAPDGTFSVGAELAVEGGLEAKHQRSDTAFEGLLGAGARCEYKFKTAAEAKEAAYLMATFPGQVAEKHGKPSAIELKGKVAIEAANVFGFGAIPQLKIKGAEEAGVSLRVDLDKSAPTLTLTAEAKLQAKALAQAGVGGASVQVHGHDAFAKGSVALEVKTKLHDPDAFLKSPTDYLKQRGPQLVANASATVTVASETSMGHHATTNELKVKTSMQEAPKFLMKIDPSMSNAELAQKAGEGVQIEMREKKWSLHHEGFDAKLEVGHTGGWLGIGKERKSLDSDRVIYKGSATDLVTGRP